MEVLYMTEKGQVTVPSAVRARRKLGCKSTLIFFEECQRRYDSPPLQGCHRP